MLREVTGGYIGFQGVKVVARGYKGLHEVKGVKGSYNQLQSVTGSDKGLPGVTER